MAELFDTAVTSLLHLPEVLDRLAAADGDRRSGGHHAAHHHGHARVHGIGGGAPVDIMETPGEYTFVLDVPGLSKSDIQVTLEEDRVLVMKGGNGKRKREEEEEGEGCRYIRLERRGRSRASSGCRRTRTRAASRRAARTACSRSCRRRRRRPSPCRSPSPRTPQSVGAGSVAE